MAPRAVDEVTRHGIGAARAAQGALPAALEIDTAGRISGWYFTPNSLSGGTVMSAVRYEPINVLRRFQDEVNRVFNDDFHYGRAAAGGTDRSQVATSTWTPAVDVKEEATRFVIIADVPGVEPGNIEITMDNGVLTIKGERVSESRDEASGYSRVERASGSFYRRFSLPDTADEQAVAATSSHGVLEVSIPKKAAVQPRRIAVQ
jgi:HSP20 family protein